MKLAAMPFLAAAILQWTFVSAAFAQTSAQPSAGQIAAAQELLKITNAESSMKNSLDGQVAMIGQQIKKAMPDIDTESLKLLENIARDEYSKKLPGILDESARIYARHFSENDLHALVAFYQTPAGRDFVSELPAVTQELSQASAELAGDILVRFRQEMEKRAPSSGPPQ